MCRGFLQVHHLPLAMLPLSQECIEHVPAWCYCAMECPLDLPGASKRELHASLGRTEYLWLPQHNPAYGWTERDSRDVLLWTEQPLSWHLAGRSALTKLDTLNRVWASVFTGNLCVFSHYFNCLCIGIPWVKQSSWQLKYEHVTINFWWYNINSLKLIYVLKTLCKPHSKTPPPLPPQKTVVLPAVNWALSASTEFSPHYAYAGPLAWC